MKGFQRGKSVKQRNIEVKKGIKKSSLTKLLHKQKKKRGKKERKSAPAKHAQRKIRYEKMYESGICELTSEKKQIEKNEETKQVLQPHVNQQKQLKESKAVVKKDDFFRPVERVVLNKKTHSTAGSNEDARVGKTNTGMMLAALSGKMLFGIDG